MSDASPHEAPPPVAEVVSSVTQQPQQGSPFRRRRLARGETRREALARRQQRPHASRAPSAAAALQEESKEAKEADLTKEFMAHEGWRTPPRKSLQTHLDRLPNSTSHAKGDQNTLTTEEVTASTWTKSDEAAYEVLPERTPALVITGAAERDTLGSPPRTQPLHEEALEEAAPQLPPLTYYRVVYRGVVALLAGPHANAPKSGSYVGYGEVFGARPALVVDEIDEAIVPTLAARPEDHASFRPPALPTHQHHTNNQRWLDSPPRSIISQAAGSVSSMDTFQTKSTVPPPPAQMLPPRRPQSMPVPDESSPEDLLLLQVEELLTGGYAQDATLEAPISHTTVAAPTLGFLWRTQKGRPLVEEVEGPPPTVEEGTFRYKVVSPTPLPILTGPAWDSPKTKAMVLPGTLHEVSRRVAPSGTGAEVCFLKLSHRRGWIATHRRGRPQAVVKEMTTTVATEEDDVGSLYSARSVLTDDNQSVLSSVAVSSSATPSAVARRRHRPPRRRRDADMSRSSAHEYARLGTPVKSSKHGGGEPHVFTPSSNVSILSDDSSLDRRVGPQQPDSPDVSYATQRSNSSQTTPSVTYHFLFRVTAPHGLAILDAPHYQVNNLIRGKPPTNPGEPQAKAHSILKTMPGRTVTANQAVFHASSKKRVIPRGALFEASKRMESSGAAFSQGAGLIKLADNSGWAIVPHRDELERQYQNFQGDITLVREGEASRAVEEVGNSFLEGNSERRSTLWFRVHARSGLTVACAPHLSSTSNDDDTSPTSSRGSSAVESNNGSAAGGFTSHESDVTSSVASTFVDAMLFRTPKKRETEQPITITQQHNPVSTKQENAISLNIPCGMCMEVERWVDLSMDQRAVEYVRLAGGQGWLPLIKGGRSVLTPTVRPEFRFGSFWFRVQAGRGIKVRLGPSVRSQSIKSDDDIHFCFECGEFLRASEIMTVFSDSGLPAESYAKLYRNRHVRLHNGHEEHRQLQSVTAQSEWVHVHNEKELFLEECVDTPRIERHKQGWRYNVIPDSGLPVRKGPSFAAETTGTRLFGGETVLINERVTPPGDKITWLRMRDGEGWLHDVDDTGTQVVIPHSLRHRARTVARSSRGTGPKEEVAYNTIIARLFHNENETARRLHGDTKTGPRETPLR